jgi:hypothetical protein
MTSNELEEESSVPASIEVSARFEKKNEEVRAYYENYKKCEDNLGIKINELALITKEENPDWTLNKIANFICIVNQDLDGFSRANVLKKVTEENKVLFNVRVTKPKGLPSPLLEELRTQKGEPLTEEEETKLHNNLTEEKNLFKNSIVPEESSITNVADQAQEEEDLYKDDEDQEAVIYDDPQKIIKQYEETILKQNKAYEELEQKYEQVIIPFEAKGSVIAPNGQEIPIIGKADPYKKTISFEIDQKEVKKLKRF